MNTARKDGDMYDQERRGQDPAPDHRLRWPEAVAITIALLFAGAVATGVFRPMLPWLG
jgi:hypothetical protein